MKLMLLRTVYLTSIIALIMACSKEDKKKKGDNNDSLFGPEPVVEENGDSGENGVDPNHGSGNDKTPLDTSIGNQSGPLFLGDEEKVFRTGNPYDANIAKIVGVKSADLKEAADYESIASKLYKESAPTVLNLQRWSSAVTAYSLLASEACKLYLAKEENQGQTIAEMDEDLTSKAFVNSADELVAKVKAGELADGQDDAVTKQVKCMTYLTLSSITYL